ncbi:MAG: PadR family transcriptional regulator [Acidobacteriota bacterium]
MKRSEPKLSESAFRVLLALADHDKHGWAILKDIEESSGGGARLSAGTLYGLLKRLLDQGLVAESAERPPQRWDDERRRYYTLTEHGRGVARLEVEKLERTLQTARRRGLLVDGVTS